MERDVEGWVAVRRRRETQVCFFPYIACLAPLARSQAARGLTSRSDKSLSCPPEPAQTG